MLLMNFCELSGIVTVLLQSGDQNHSKSRCISGHARIAAIRAAGLTKMPSSNVTKYNSSRFIVRSAQRVLSK